MKIEIHDALRVILAEHKEYHPEAYHSIYLATNPTSGTQLDTPDRRPAKHLTARELYTTLCHQALEEYGPMALTVFRHWGLKSAADVAQATYYMIQAGILSKQRHESREDFLHLPTLEEMLDTPFAPRS